MKIYPVSGSGKIYDIRLLKGLRLFIYKWFGVGAFKHFTLRESKDILYDVKHNYSSFDYCRRWINDSNTLLTIHFKHVQLHLLKRTKKAA